MRTTRRQLLQGAVGSSGLLLLNCASRGAAAPAADAGSDAASGVCADAFAGGTLAGEVPILSAGTAPLDTAFGAGLDGRLYTDLSKLTADMPTTPTDRFYLRTRYPDLLDPNAPWKIAVHGLVASDVDLTLADLDALAVPMGVHVMECSGNGDFSHFGMLGAADWSGVPLADLLAKKASVSPSATRVLVSGFDSYSVTPSNSVQGASWIFSLDELAQTRAFLARTMNGAPLTPDHGFPVRLMVPGWYGCTCIKWVNEIALVDDSAPATSQMTEYASRTMQNGTPALARDFASASIDQAAMPVRIEKWNVAGAVVYRVIGVMWGGSTPSDALSIRFNPDLPFDHVDVCPPASSNATWTWWSYAWRPASAGTYEIRLKVDDPAVRQRRLDSGFYARKVAIADV